MSPSPPYPHSHTSPTYLHSPTSPAYLHSSTSPSCLLSPVSPSFTHCSTLPSFTSVSTLLLFTHLSTLYSILPSFTHVFILHIHTSPLHTHSQLKPQSSPLKRLKQRCVNSDQTQTSGAVCIHEQWISPSVVFIFYPPFKLKKIGCLKRV